MYFLKTRQLSVCQSHLQSLSSCLTVVIDSADNSLIILNLESVKEYEFKPI